MNCLFTTIMESVQDVLFSSYVVPAAVLLIIIITVIKSVSLIQKFLKKSALLKKFPHDPPNWLLGHILDIPFPDEAGLKWQREMTAKYPSDILVWFGPFLPGVCLNTPQSIKPILKSAEPKGKLYRLIKPWVGDGLLLSSGEKWARNRRLLTPAFHFEILKPYLHIKNRAADKFCSNIRSFADTNEYFEECDLVTMFSLDVILKCAFSYETNCQDTGSTHPFVKAINELGIISLKRFMKPILHPDWIFSLTSDGRQFKRNCEYVHHVAEEVISKRRKFLEENIKEPPSPERKRYTDFLDILLTSKDENDVGLTDKEIRDEVDTFLFEGHDTTASAISWTLYSIAQHGEIQDNIQREIDSLLTGRQTDDLMASDLNEVPYLTMCIKESLRLHCVVSFIMRHTSQDYKVNGNILPKDTMTIISIYSLHHNPTIWEDSMEFRPERFSPENIKKINPFANIPFSAGPRNCIGQNFAMHEIKVLLVKVLHRFFLEVDPHHVVGKVESIVMKAENGIRLKATNRRPGQYRYD